MSRDVSGERISYERGRLRRDDLTGPGGDAAAEPFALFERWLEEAFEAKERGELSEPTAVALATAEIVDGVARPSVRMVLLKDFGPRGLVIWTHTNSRKGRELTANPYASILCHWEPLERQVRFSGRVERMEDVQADLYFSRRPRGSQLGAWASPQSNPVASSMTLERAWERADRDFPGVVPRPPQWGGFRLVPEEIEFWQGRPNRLHDRLHLRLGDDGWRVTRLAP